MPNYKYFLTSDGRMIQISDDELMHYGVLGMKWGVRRYQNANGTLTSAGKKRYSSVDGNVLNEGDYKYRSSTTVKSIARTAVSYIPVVGSIAFVADVGKAAYYGTDKKKDYASKEGEYEKLSKLKRKTTKTTADEDLANVNPNYGKRGTVKNCMLCTATMEMRRRGYDVQARSAGQG